MVGGAVESPCPDGTPFWSPPGSGEYRVSLGPLPCNLVWGGGCTVSACGGGWDATTGGGVIFGGGVGGGGSVGLGAGVINEISSGGGSARTCGV